MERKLSNDEIEDCWQSPNLLAERVEGRKRVERKRGAFQTPTGTVQGANRLRWKEETGRAPVEPTIGRGQLRCRLSL